MERILRSLFFPSPSFRSSPFVCSFSARYESLPQTGASTSHISFWLGVSFIVFVLFILQGGNKSEKAKYEY
ncbi:LPXTG cell wall anchor domain-containing protein [Ligilactobacillus murinus]|uniref:LPXTG cell wall anchor domain-containing protein n=1 Tax=Ligilactobacillus murinus TaxID=1622 RepID=UPI001C8C2DD6|nr:LPXTG cell wall anchor domain-containing protein [Ligilactobacillus murinus]